jgi:hypothetical protein
MFDSSQPMFAFAAVAVSTTPGLTASFRTNSSSTGFLRSGILRTHGDLSTPHLVHGLHLVQWQMSALM